MLESLPNKIAGFQACNFIKKRPQHGCFSVNIVKFLKRLILKNICEGLLLNLVLPISLRGRSNVPISTSFYQQRNDVALNVARATSIY